MASIRIGISGWSYKDWRGSFYPDDLPREDELGYAASRFDTLEINGTFYGLTTPAVCREWYQVAPRGFVYSVKGSRFITHNKKLSDVESALANFFASGVLELREKLGPILWQLPERSRFEAERVDRFLGMLPRDTDTATGLARRHDDRIEEAGYGDDANHRVRHVFEPRHESFLQPEMARIARRHGVALAFSHSSGWPYVEEITAGFVYLRLHGPDEIYDSAYGAETLRSWADRISSWQAGREPEDPARISDLQPPRRKGRDVYVYFDNTAGGQAPREALKLRELVGRA